MFEVSKKQGFTLIELLVVISIIGLLSSVVLASLNSARLKSKESAFKQELIQFRNIMNLEYSDSGNYGNLSTGAWAGFGPVAPAETCDTVYPLNQNVSKYITQANLICKKIVEISTDQYSFYVTGNTSAFSVQGWLKPQGLLYCVGTTGNTFGKAWGDGPGVANPMGLVVYNNPGCSNSL